MDPELSRAQAARNLADAGCGEGLFAAGRAQEGLDLLAGHRRLDCLDDLVYRLEQSRTGREESAWKPSR